jgi:hypothetical protein
MPRRNSLFLYEEIMLLALRDKQGTIASGAMYRHAIGGAILAELLMSGRIGVDESRKNKKIADIIDTTPVGDPLIDEVLDKMRTAKRRAALQTWVARISGTKKLKQRVAEQLCKRGILRADEDKILLIFKRKTYPELDPGPEKKLIGRLHDAIFTDKKNLDPRTTVLVSLADSTGLLKANFDKKKLKRRKERIKQIVNGEVSGKATRDAIQAMQAAVMVTVIIPSVVS